MNAGAILLAIVRFACWEAALLAASIRLARLIGWRDDRRTAELWLAVLAIQLTLESSFAAIFSFAGVNSQPTYWVAAGVCLLVGIVGQVNDLPRFVKRSGSGGPPTADQPSGGQVGDLPHKLLYALIAALVAPLVLVSFKPVEEIDSINYLHYLIEWLANRATPYTFATNYVAFWELSFAPAWMVTICRRR